MKDDNMFSLPIDKNSQISISDQIVHNISKLILNGDAVPGFKLPPERELAESLGISRGTVKRAYLKLCEAKAIYVIPGSGSYVSDNEKILEKNQRQEATEIISKAFSQIHSMGLSNEEIQSLVNLFLSSKSSEIKSVAIMVVSNNHEILAELENQLSYLANSSVFTFTLTFMTLESIAKNPSAENILGNYDIIIATTIDYSDIVSLSPELNGKIHEAHIRPKKTTIQKLSHFPKDTRFRVIYRTRNFKNIVVAALTDLGYSHENIIETHELDYRPESHFTNDIDVIVNFNESPVYTNRAFKRINQEFTDNGGEIIHFEYKIDRESLTDIEKKIYEIINHS